MVRIQPTNVCNIIVWQQKDTPVDWKKCIIITFPTCDVNEASNVNAKATSQGQRQCKARVSRPAVQLKVHVKPIDRMLQIFQYIGLGLTD